MKQIYDLNAQPKFCLSSTIDSDKVKFLVDYFAVV